MKTHQRTRTPEYYSWLKMRERCNLITNNRYQSHGARGIKVCTRWQESFTNFLEDMGERPDRTSLERIDNNGNYEPSNCRWATAKDQARNRRSSLFITINGRKQTLAEWCEELNLNYNTVQSRRTYGWSIERALGL